MSRSIPGQHRATTPRDERETPDTARVESIFNSAVERPPEERSAFVDEACDGQAGLRARVLRLLDCFDQHAARLEYIPSSLLEDDEPLSPEARAGEQVGPYELTRILASGGMGTVWLARRADAQFEKQVAIKLIKRGMDSDALLSRFRTERQVLASLEHPNIARLLDGGMTADGLPYLVMEYVDGLPIDRYSDENKLTIEQRLQLFRAVCAPVHYAHQNLVVHRDLKPGNILIAAEAGPGAMGSRRNGREKSGNGETRAAPGRPYPKLLDFGIAKVLHSDGSEATKEATAPDLRIMTPRYASPEQVRGEKITTASDVYSLGVILFELLTGHEPYELTTRSRFEYERAICDRDPLRPSTAVGRVVDF